MNKKIYLFTTLILVFAIFQTKTVFGGLFSKSITINFPEITGTLNNYPQYYKEGYDVFINKIMLYPYNNQGIDKAKGLEESEYITIDGKTGKFTIPSYSLLVENLNGFNYAELLISFQNSTDKSFELIKINEKNEKIGPTCSDSNNQAVYCNAENNLFMLVTPEIRIQYDEKSCGDKISSYATGLVDHKPWINFDSYIPFGPHAMFNELGKEISFTSNNLYTPQTVKKHIIIDTAYNNLNRPDFYTSFDKIDVRQENGFDDNTLVSETKALLEIEQNNLFKIKCK
jgi:hypothetical protein